jgi:hypothetical protein
LNAPGDSGDGWRHASEPNRVVAVEALEAPNDDSDDLVQDLVAAGSTLAIADGKCVTPATGFQTMSGR